MTAIGRRLGVVVFKGFEMLGRTFPARSWRAWRSWSPSAWWAVVKALRNANDGLSMSWPRSRLGMTFGPLAVVLLSRSLWHWSA